MGHCILSVCWSYLFVEGCIITYKRLIIVLVNVMAYEERSLTYVTSCLPCYVLFCRLQLGLLSRNSLLWWNGLAIYWFFDVVGLGLAFKQVRISWFDVFLFPIGLAGSMINWALRPVFILLSLCLCMIKVGRVEGIFSFSTEGRESRDFVEGYFAITSSHFE